MGAMGGRKKRRNGLGIVAAVVVALAVLGGVMGDDDGSSGRSASQPQDTSTVTTLSPGAVTPAEQGPATGLAADSTTNTVPDATGVPGGPLSAIPPVPDAPVTAMVDQLVVSTAGARADYRRKAFGGDWSYNRRTGCNTRHLVLIEESLVSPTVTDRCKVRAGDWRSVYDGRETTDPADLQIDHLVPLAEAWRSGAENWTEARREAFANDLDDPATLVAVSGSSNQSKSDSSPDKWLPPSVDARCQYVSDWVRVKYRWSLTVTPAEKAVIVQILQGC